MDQVGYCATVCRLKIIHSNTYYLYKSLHGWSREGFHSFQCGFEFLHVMIYRLRERGWIHAETVHIPEALNIDSNEVL